MPRIGLRAHLPLTFFRLAAKMLAGQLEGLPLALAGARLSQTVSRGNGAQPPWRVLFGRQPLRMRQASLDAIIKTRA